MYQLFTVAVLNCHVGSRRSLSEAKLRPQLVRFDPPQTYSGSVADVPIHRSAEQRAFGDGRSAEEATRAGRHAGCAND